MNNFSNKKIFIISIVFSRCSSFKTCHLRLTLKGENYHNIDVLVNVNILLMSILFDEFILKRFTVVSLFYIEIFYIKYMSKIYFKNFIFNDHTHPSNQVLSYWNLMLYNFFPSCFIIGLRVPNNEMSTINLILRMIATG